MGGFFETEFDLAEDAVFQWDEVKESTVLADVAWTLTLEELLPDDGAEIVLIAPDDSAINVTAGERVVDSGSVESHVTAAGIDVSGFAFLTFETGITLYYDGDVVVTAAG